MVPTAGTPDRPRQALAALLLVIGIMFTSACSADGPVEVSLATLASQQEQWDGRTVLATGSVRSYDEPLHFWIEDVQVNRVELRPQDGLDDLVGRTIEVTGIFRFEEGRGRWIEVGALDVLDTSS